MRSRKLIVKYPGQVCLNRVSTTWFCLLSFQLLTSSDAKRVATTSNQSGRQIVSTDLKTGGFEGFVVPGAVWVTQQDYILIVEAERDSIDAAMGQGLVVMKDVRDCIAIVKV